ncbi:MAG TPA: DUF6763 family protein [Gammaproteobacteria bacterium]
MERSSVNAEVDPIVGYWYRRVDKGQTFTVVGVDEDEGIIEIQHADGEVEEIDEAAWADMELEVVDEPDEWRGALDDVEDEDLDYTDDGTERDVDELRELDEDDDEWDDSRDERK